MKVDLQLHCLPQRPGFVVEDLDPALGVVVLAWHRRDHLRGSLVVVGSGTDIIL